MAYYDFDDRLCFSLGKNEEDDINILKSYIDGCVSVAKTDTAIDKQGIDYYAFLRNKAIIKIDAKTRSKGCSRYWRFGPELALETWSVKPTKYRDGKVGWTLDEKKEVDLILFKFDKVDSDNVYLLPYQHLRMAFRRNFFKWKGKYKTDVQTSNSWQSECIFVPADEVLNEITKTMKLNMTPATFVAGVF